MADSETVVHIGENSPEKIAFDLLRMILVQEGGSKNFDRAKLLDAYAECIEAVKGYRNFRG